MSAYVRSVSSVDGQMAIDLDRDADLLIEPADVARLGYGTANTVRLRIRSGELPAVKVGGRWKVRVGDLPRPAETATDTAPPTPDGHQDLDALAKALVATFPPLGAEQIAELGRILSAAAASSASVDSTAA
ncbi:helix-turn-helix domain-containing protein [Janibacter terrae]|uniref:helix-turn-helix domain-containing protein n=1 Tax=Janibacter terrae TaxID=103817 RepID=UPI0031F9877A